MNHLYIDLVQIAPCHAAKCFRLDPVRYSWSNQTFVIKQTQTVVSKHKINFNLQTCILFASSIAALKARNNRISNQNLSEAVQNYARSFENKLLSLSLNISGTRRDIFIKEVNGIFLPIQATCLIRKGAIFRIVPLFKIISPSSCCSSSHRTPETIS